jgi:hypothetical protein
VQSVILKFHFKNHQSNLKEKKKEMMAGAGKVMTARNVKLNSCFGNQFGSLSKS